MGNERNGCDDRDDCDARALGLAVDMGVTRLSGAKDIRMVCYIASITQQPLRRFASSRRVCSQRSTVKYGCEPRVHPGSSGFVIRCALRSAPKARQGP